MLLCDPICLQFSLVVGLHSSIHTVYTCQLNRVYSILLLGKQSVLLNTTTTNKSELFVRNNGNLTTQIFSPIYLTLILLANAKIIPKNVLNSAPNCFQLPCFIFSDWDILQYYEQVVWRLSLLKLLTVAHSEDYDKHKFSF